MAAVTTPAVDYTNLVVPATPLAGLLGSGVSIAGANIGLNLTTRTIRDTLTVALGVGLCVFGIVFVLMSSKAGTAALNVATDGLGGAAKSVVSTAKKVTK